MSTLDAGTAGALRVDPLAPCHPGRWEHGRVTVCHADRAAVPVRLVANRRPDARTAHFEVHRTGGRLLVLHRTRPDELDDDLAGRLAAELGAPGLVESAADFERVFTGIVRSTINDPITGWSTFYANALATLREPGKAPEETPAPRSPEPHPPAPHPPAPHPPAHESSLAAFAPVHERAVAEIVGRTVLDLGSCFGFLPLRLAAEGLAVTASDHTPGTMALLAAVARHRGDGIRTLVADARAVPVASRSVDTVTAVHLLEHLPAADTDTVLGEAMRVARRRVVVAVPYEDVPEPVYGHLRCFDHPALAELGARSGWRHRVDDHHGGWLILDR